MQHVVVPSESGQPACPAPPDDAEYSANDCVFDSPGRSLDMAQFSSTGDEMADLALR